MCPAHDAGPVALGETTLPSTSSRQLVTTVALDPVDLI